MKQLLLVALGLVLSSAAILALVPQDPSKPAAAPAPAAADDNWPTWRGPALNGAAPAGNPPIEWSEEKNIRWKVKVPGVGSSTPVVWKDRLYVLTAIETDRDGKPPEIERPEPPDRGGRGERGGNRGGERGGRGGPPGGGRVPMGTLPPPTKVWQFAVVALDRKSGTVAWSTVVKEAVPHEGGHQTGSQASGSPITDGQHIWAFFGSRGIHCLDMNGKLVWSKELGYMLTRRSFGEGSSPALHGNTLVINWDHEGDSFIVALDKRDGKELWRQPRDESTGWATPVIATVGDEAQVIVTGTTASRAYDLASGKLLWTLGGMTTNCIPSPIFDQGTVYLMSGFRGAALQAVEVAGAKGDLAKSDKVKWQLERNTSYVPSALLYDGNLYFVRSNSGVLSCVEAKTGKPLYEGERLGLKTIYASPVGVNGRIYLPSREGVTKVIAAGPEFEVLATNELDDVLDASPVVIGDELYLRGHDHLYCIAETKAKQR